MNNIGDLPKVDLKEHRRVFSYTGFSCALFLVLTYITQYAAVYVCSTYFPSFIDNPAYIWVVSFIPMYCIAAPIFMLMMRKLPSEKPEKKKIGFFSFIKFFLIGYFLMYIGNLIGIVFTSMFSLFGIEMQNSLNDLLTDSDTVFIVAIVVIIGPIMEEIICRKFICGKLLKYGDRTAILVSALIFALLHGNFFQFFYAFLLGCVLAYVYIKSGKLIYSILLHMLINFNGSVIALKVIESLDRISKLYSGTASSMASLAPEDVKHLVFVVVYFGVVFSMIVTGLALFCIYFRSANYQKGSIAISGAQKTSAALINFGMILYFIMSAASFVASIIA